MYVLAMYCLELLNTRHSVYDWLYQRVAVFLSVARITKEESVRYSISILPPTEEQFLFISGSQIMAS